MFRGRHSLRRDLKRSLVYISGCSSTYTQPKIKPHQNKSKKQQILGNGENLISRIIISLYLNIQFSTRKPQAMPKTNKQTKIRKAWPGSGRSPEEGNDNLLQYSCLENSMDRGLFSPMDCSPPGSSVQGFSKQEHWSGLPFPSPMRESET